MNRSSKSYYFYIEVDNGMPYELKVSKDAYKNFKEGKTSKVLAEVRTGKLGFSYVGNFKTQRVVQAENEIKRINPYFFFSVVSLLVYKNTNKRAKCQKKFAYFGCYTYLCTQRHNNIITKYLT